MRNVLGMIGALALASAAGCAGQSNEQTQQSTTPAQQTQQTSAVDPAAISPERQDAIERLFQRKVGELQDCWTQEYQKTHDRKLEGDLTLQLMVAANGQPSDVKVLKSTMNNADVERCVAQQVAGWSFPEGNTTIPYTRTVHLGAQF